MAIVNASKIKQRRLEDPPTRNEVRNTTAEPEPGETPSLLQDRARASVTAEASRADMMVEPDVPRPVEVVDPAKRGRGRPAKPEKGIGFATRLRPQAYDDLQRIAGRDRFTQGELVERALQAYEAMRVAQALEATKRQEGESDDDLIRRAFRL